MFTFFSFSKTFPSSQNTLRYTFVLPHFIKMRKKTQVRYNDNNSSIVSILAFITLKVASKRLFRNISFTLSPVFDNLNIVVVGRHFLYYFKMKGLKNHLQSINWLLLLFPPTYYCLTTSCFVVVQHRDI